MPRERLGHRFMLSHIQDDWWEEALCRRLTVEVDGLSAQDVANLFHPTRNSTPVEIQAAKAVCQGCGVREACLDFALNSWQKNGIWGGLSYQERRVILKGRRARPPALPTLTESGRDPSG